MTEKYKVSQNEVEVLNKLVQNIGFGEQVEFLLNEKGNLIYYFHGGYCRFKIEDGRYGVSVLNSHIENIKKSGLTKYETHIYSKLLNELEINRGAIN